MLDTWTLNTCLLGMVPTCNIWADFTIAVLAVVIKTVHCRQQRSQERLQSAKRTTAWYDVYVHSSQPLAEGEEKHVISVFVADESGLINRVAGVFARRGTCAAHV